MWNCVGDETEPAPIVPARSERLSVQSSRRRPLVDDVELPAHQTLSRKSPGDLSSTQVGRRPRAASSPASKKVPSPKRECTHGEPQDFEGGLAGEGRRSPSSRRCCAKTLEPTSGTPLHIAVWLADKERIDELLDAGAAVDELDERGTPLMLAVELLPRAREYEEILVHLLHHGADPRLRSAAGWSPVDEAVSQGDQRIVQLLFEEARRGVQQRWEARLSFLVRSLEALPDFDCSLRWEFESPVVPMLHKIAPSDVWRIKKRGTSLRLDSTLASWKRFRFNKRRDLTTLFRGAHCSFEDGSAKPSLCLLNHTKHTVVDITEGIDQDETSAIVEDLLAGDCVQWDMQVKNVEVAETMNWLGQSAPPVDLNGWVATKFDVRGSVGVFVRRKGKKSNSSTFEEYFGCPLPADVCLPELRQEFARETTHRVATDSGRSDSTEGGHLTTNFELGGWADYLRDVPHDIDEISTTSEVLSQWSEPELRGDTRLGKGTNGPHPRSLSVGSTVSAGLSPGGRRSARQGTDRIGRSTRTVSASVWLAANFAIPMQQFLPVLEALSVEHDAMRRLLDLLRSQSVQTAAERVHRAKCVSGDTGHVFPVKVSVPLNMAVRATVHCESFTLHGLTDEADFQIPNNYTWTARSEAQKTLSRTRKRALLAHLAL